MNKFITAAIAASLSLTAINAFSQDASPPTPNVTGPNSHMPETATGQKSTSHAMPSDRSRMKECMTHRKELKDGSTRMQMKAACHDELSAGKQMDKAPSMPDHTTYAERSTSQPEQPAPKPDSSMPPPSDSSMGKPETAPKN